MPSAKKPPAAPKLFNPSQKLFQPEPVVKKSKATSIPRFEKTNGEIKDYDNKQSINLNFGPTAEA